MEAAVDLEAVIKKMCWVVSLRSRVAQAIWRDRIESNAAGWKIQETDGKYPKLRRAHSGRTCMVPNFIPHGNIHA
ncbi:hypothetical protein GCM10008020_25210 [Massilia psychrophila]|nr:hypothetical protein GCM10008020_25210 [Massilia psychrophila]